MDITVKKLHVHPDERGYLYEMLRCDDPQFSRFGQAYCNMTEPGAVKGFHCHKKNIDNLVCVSGRVKLVLVDTRSEQPIIEEHFMGIDNPIMVTIPPGVWHGWKSIGPEPSLVINMSSQEFFPDSGDDDRIDPHENPWGYSWERVDK